jgi:hypothetical protein
LSLLDTKPPASETERPADDVPSARATAAKPCPTCGTPLEPGQLACVECGHVLRRRRLIPSGWPLRAGLASTVALLVSACAGLGVSAAFQGGGKVPKTVAVAPPPTATPPPSTPAPTPPAPAAPAPAAPHAAAPSPAKPAAPAHPTTPSTPSNGGHGGPTPNSSTAIGPQSTSPAKPGGGNPAPFPQGIPFDSAYLLDPNDTADHPNDTQNAIDGDAKTVWQTATYPSGPLAHAVNIWFDSGSYNAYPTLGLLAKGQAYTITVYGSNANNAPSGAPGPGSGWTALTGPVTVQPGKNRIAFNQRPAGFQPRYYLISITAITGTSAVIADTALLG